MSTSKHKLYQLLCKYQRVVRVEQRIKAISEKIKREKDMLETWDNLISEEYQAIANLEEFSLRLLFSKILLNKDQQLEKKRQDYLLAVLKHRGCLKMIKLLEYELNILHDQVEDKTKISIDIEKEMILFKKNNNIENFEDLKKLDNTIEYLRDQIKLNTEITEALIVANELRDNFGRMVSLMNSAQNQHSWGEYYNEIQEAKKQKKSYLDQAQSHLHLILKLLVILKSELKDVKELQEYYYKDDRLNGFHIDFYSNLIADWLGDENLMKTMTSTLKASKVFANLKKTLQVIEDESKNQIESLKEKREYLLEELGFDHIKGQ